MIAIANEVQQLVSFQRHPQYVIPNGDGPVSKAYRDRVNQNYDTIWEQARNSIVAHGLEGSTVPAMSVSEKDRERVFEEIWRTGNGIRFLLSFGDIIVDEQANEEACKFIRKKISQIITDPENVRKLTPHDLFARRPVTANGYYEMFSHKHVDVINIQATPIEVTPQGIATSDGTFHQLDVIILAIGFEAVDGNYTRIAIKGSGGEVLGDHWAAGPTSYLGIAVPGFPNIFMVQGPKGPFGNVPPIIEAEIDFIASIVARAELGREEKLTQPPQTARKPVALVQATQRAEDEWAETCNEASEKVLYRKGQGSWLYGGNIPGKKRSVLFYLGGLASYRKHLQYVTQNGYQGFEILY